jgi:hypothetical protein
MRVFSSSQDEAVRGGQNCVGYDECPKAAVVRLHPLRRVVVLDADEEGDGRWDEAAVRDLRVGARRGAVGEGASEGVLERSQRLDRLFGGGGGLAAGGVRRVERALGQQAGLPKRGKSEQGERARRTRGGEARVAIVDPDP